MLTNSKMEKIFMAKTSLHFKNVHIYDKLSFLTALQITAQLKKIK